MFKKLVMGTLATGIVLTGGIGASAATFTADDVKSSKALAASVCPPSSNTLKMEMTNKTGVFANVWDQTEKRIKWYFKAMHFNQSTGIYTGCYEGQKY
ncbi:hypothetical protein COD78_21465 [Bacillus cereus]|uniref:LCI fold-containing protein n=1 Tax=Bacillus TaxID=1386 RepID=UPI0001A0EFA3|nr:MULTISPECIES: LCI fold-containing protein [Bacillus]EEL52779.1 hypothetical protein bcere0023_56870 [Bacillus cereus Rock4-2]KAF6687534.1 hypothetical protein HFD78_28860 [Bacillus sp. EKM501B]MBE5096004.1 hypothetical protein [Bacillus thuringiensis]MEB9543387.1 LCI family antimicrobial peptide [Bacillus cereus]PEQ68721.1 hypothetical protein CN469_02605 [Bacillus cereus]